MLVDDLITALANIEHLGKQWLNEGDDVLPHLKTHLTLANGLIDAMMIGNKYLTEGAD